MRKLLLVLHVALLPILAVADGRVLSREASPAERTFILECKSALRESLPKIPQGWASARESPLDAEKTIIFAEAERPIEVSYENDLVRSEGMEARQAAYRAAEERAEPGNQKLRRLMDSINQFSREMATASSAGDRPAYEKARAAKEQAEREYDSFMESSENPVEILANAGRELHKDVEVKYRAVVNSPLQKISGKLIDLAIPGAAAAVRIDPELRSGPDREALSRVLVLVGAWEISRRQEGARSVLEGRHVFQPGESTTLRANAAIKLEASPDRISALVSELKLTSLGALH